MRTTKTRLAFVVLCLPLVLAAQDQNAETGKKLFDRGMAHYEAGRPDSAVVLWTAIVENNLARQYDVYGSAFFNIPTLYWQMQQYDQAKHWYKKVLESDLRDSDETGSLMEPHTNYKHKSALALAGLYRLDSNYTEALHWVHMADTVYRYWGFEGSATNVSLVHASLLQWKTELLLAQGHKEDAIREIFTTLVCSGTLNGFFADSERDLEVLISKKAFRKDLDRALENASVAEKTKHRWELVFTLHGLRYKILFTDETPARELPHYWQAFFIEKQAEKPKRDRLVKIIRSSALYESLQ